MKKQERLISVMEKLKEIYPEAVCSLNASNPFELLVAVRLSAQCTDARVNIVTPALFERYKTLEDYANADIKEVQTYIKSCGFYKEKAKSIVLMAQKIISDFSSRVPDTIEELITLPGVGRKTANLIVGDVYGKESVVVDTHMIRISNRIGLVREKDPKKIEFALKKIMPKGEGSSFCHRIVLFGRDFCSARKPKCTDCPIKDYCRHIGVERQR